MSDLRLELYSESAPADRCPHLAFDGDCYCRRPSRREQGRAVTCHASLQLWCLAGPERWPVCIFYPKDKHAAPENQGGQQDPLADAPSVGVHPPDCQ